MDQKTEKVMRQQLVSHVQGGLAFNPVSNMLEHIPFNKLGIRPASLPYSFYELFYHMWMAQNDVLAYCLNTDYQAPAWPDGYWPEQQAPDSKKKWCQLKQQFYNERDELCQLIMDFSVNLNSSLENNPEHTLLREIEIVIEHNAYHTGQLMVIYRLLDVTN